MNREPELFGDFFADAAIAGKLQAGDLALAQRSGRPLPAFVAAKADLS